MDELAEGKEKMLQWSFWGLSFEAVKTRMFTASCEVFLRLEPSQPRPFDVQ
jgi:hypothetical protein